jgi:hypothetical protein
VIGSVALANVLAPVLAFAFATVLADECSAGDEVFKWRADPHLVQERSSTNCGFQFREPIAIEFDGHVVKTGPWSRQTFDMVLLEPLAADGSGEVNGVSMPQNRSIVINFAPGRGPRTFTYWLRYNPRCYWQFVPL